MTWQPTYALENIRGRHLEALDEIRARLKRETPILSHEQQIALVTELNDRFHLSLHIYSTTFIKFVRRWTK